MYARTSWSPGGLYGPREVPIPVGDPEASLYQCTNWHLIKSAAYLDAFDGWGDSASVTVVCLEAIRERASLSSPWCGCRGRVLYVSRGGVEGLPEGPVHPSYRFLLRDLDRARAA